jgi:putative flippase GtrA
MTASEPQVGQKHAPRTLLTFAAIGTAATLLHYATAYALMRLFEWPPVVASSIGYALSAIANYAANARFTFGVRERHAHHFARFAVVAGLGWLLNAAVLWLFLSLGLHPFVAQPLVTASVMSVSFILNARWAMR